MLKEAAETPQAGGLMRTRLASPRPTCTPRSYMRPRVHTVETAAFTSEPDLLQAPLHPWSRVWSHQEAETRHSRISLDPASLWASAFDAPALEQAWGQQQPTEDAAEEEGEEEEDGVAALLVQMMWRACMCTRAAAYCASGSWPSACRAQPLQ